MKTSVSSQKKRQLLVISSYPPGKTTHHHAVIGGASYAKETLVHLIQEILRKKGTPEITVLCEKLPGETTLQTDHGVSLKRIWQKDSPLTPFILAKEALLTYPHTKDVLLELELTMFGRSGIFLTLLLPLLLILRIFGKRIFIVFHQVITDLNALAPHLNLTPRTWRVYLLSLCLRIFYTSVLSLVNHSIVFEDILKERLKKYGTAKNISVIPLAVTKLPKIISKKQARKTLSLSDKEFIIVSFGFLAWYKGTDWLVKEFERKKPRGIHLIIAGGANPNRIPYRFYQRYVKEIERVCHINGITHTGFVDEKDMELYFQAADVIIFPYREIISSSYPLSLAFSYGKPVMLSEKMNILLKSRDFHNVYKNGMRSSPLFFPLDATFFPHIKQLKRFPKHLQKLKTFSKTMAHRRSWAKVQKKYYSVFFGQ